MSAGDGTQWPPGWQPPPGSSAALRFQGGVPRRAVDRSAERASREGILDRLDRNAASGTAYPPGQPAAIAAHANPAQLAAVRELLAAAEEAATGCSDCGWKALRLRAACTAVRAAWPQLEES